MNTLINDLKYRAGLTAQVSCKEMPDYDHMAIERFARLIVNECANELLRWQNEPFQFDPEFAAKIIKQHFGIPPHE
jgi:hypothetical protein